MPFKELKIVLSILFLVCLFNMPYGYYQLVRFIAMIAFIILAHSIHKKSMLWFILWLSSAILINPFQKIALGRVVWNGLDLIWVALLIISLFNYKKYVEEV